MLGVACAERRRLVDAKLAFFPPSPPPSSAPPSPAMLPRLSRPLLRASLPRALPRVAVAAPLRPFYSSPARLEAREQAGAPASGSFGQAAKNVKQEASQLRASIESAVAGGSGGKEDKGHDAGELFSDAVSGMETAVTKAQGRRQRRGALECPHDEPPGTVCALPASTTPARTLLFYSSP
jgi:hypothetical protein